MHPTEHLTHSLTSNRTGWSRNVRQFLKNRPQHLQNLGSAGARSGGSAGHRHRTRSLHTAQHQTSISQTDPTAKITGRPGRAVRKTKADRPPVGARTISSLSPRCRPVRLSPHFLRAARLLSRGAHTHEDLAGGRGGDCFREGLTGSPLPPSPRPPDFYFWTEKEREGLFDFSVPPLWRVNIWILLCFFFFLLWSSGRC